MADEAKISAFLSTDAHSYKAPRVSHPDRVVNPKSVMMNHFKQARGRPYEDNTDAIKVLSATTTNLKRLRRSSRFVRFESKLR